MFIFFLWTRSFRLVLKVYCSDVSNMKCKMEMERRFKKNVTVTVVCAVWCMRQTGISLGFFALMILLNCINIFSTCVLAQSASLLTWSFIWNSCFHVGCCHNVYNGHITELHDFSFPSATSLLPTFGSYWKASRFLWPTWVIAGVIRVSSNSWLLQGTVVPFYCCIYFLLSEMTVFLKVRKTWIVWGWYPAGRDN